MNAEQIAKALRSCARNCDGSHGCWHSAVLKEAASLIESLQSQLAESRRREKAAVADLQAFVEYPCGVCAHLQDQRFCYLNCQNHDRENHRAWQWRGPSDREAHHDA